ncbi:MAG: bifunctional folylpolyglutamate synthase/dihydrofolate synthase [Phycisphaerales bacterium]|nr:bifunctional folylpolyglutamate synthase/dihydrofolate synthase [Phycisphaerales bacterium]
MAKQTASRTKTRARTSGTGGARRAAPVSKPRSSGTGKKIGSEEITTYTTAVRYLMNRTDVERMRVIRRDDTFKLDRMRALLQELGNPQDQIKTVHVAGTVGKGSTVAMISAMLRECGYAVGEYTSPHLIDLRERIRIGGQLIDRPGFTELMKAVAQAAEAINEEPTYFEVLTALAFRHFAEEAVDIAIIETGLGGRLDSTNVITPEVSVITRIALDHERLLGDTVEAIAREKAGIMKPDVPALIFDQGPEVEEVFRSVAEEVGARLQVVNKDIEFSNRFCSTSELGPHTRVCLYSDSSRFEHLPVPLAGTHQATNCGLALAVVDMLKNCGFDCPENLVTIGLDKTKINGRMELVWDQPRILVDGAHNPEALGALMKCVGAHVPYDSMVCVFGCCQDKEIDAMLDMMNFGADKVIFTKASTNPRAADPLDLQKAFSERSGKMSQTAASLPEALELAARAVGREDLLCVTGSFYLVGETMKHLEKSRQG